MQVVKLVKSDELSCEERKKIFESIGFTFINRLLATSWLLYLCDIVSLIMFYQQMRLLKDVWRIPTIKLQ